MMRTLGYPLACLAVSCAAAFVLLDLSGGAAARLVALASLVLIAAPLCWPAAAPARALAPWSVALGLGTAAAGIALGVAPTQAARVAVVLALLLLASHAALVAAGPAGDTGRLALVALLAALGFGPVWLGPAAAAAGDGALRDAILAASPLVHLAVAADADLLRTTWFYAHTLLGSVRFDYPPLAAVVGADLAIAAGAVTYALWRARRAARAPHPPGAPALAAD